MGLGNLVQYIDERSQRSKLADYARQYYGESDPKLAALADISPEAFLTIVGQQYDPKTQLVRQQQSALAALAGGGADGGGTPAPPSYSGAPSGSEGGAWGQLAGAQQQALSPLAVLQQAQPRSIAANAAEDGELSRQQQQLLAMADPGKFVDYLVKAPERKTQRQKDQADLAKTKVDTQKAAYEAEAPERGKKQLNALLGDLKGYYDELDKLGGIINTDKNPAQNIFNAFAASEPVQAWGQTIIPGGQDINRMRGTKEQELRDKIASRIPLVSAAVKNAAGMSSQQLNSNLELQAFLRALSTPGQSYQAATEALRGIGGTFGAQSAAAPDLKSMSTEQLKQLRSRLAK